MQCIYRNDFHKMFYKGSRVFRKVFTGYIKLRHRPAAEDQRERRDLGKNCFWPPPPPLSRRRGNGSLGGGGGSAKKKKKKYIYIYIYIYIIIFFFCFFFGRPPPL